MADSQLEQFKKERPKIKKEIQQQTTGYILAAFGFVAGLAWNEAIKAIIDYVFPVISGSLWAKLIYALLVTILVIIVGIYLNKLADTKEN